jgi:hypothetical protein
MEYSKKSIDFFTVTSLHSRQSKSCGDLGIGLRKSGGPGDRAKFPWRGSIEGDALPIEEAQAIRHWKPEPGDTLSRSFYEHQ